jgi:hypothetical protein
MATRHKSRKETGDQGQIVALEPSELVVPPPRSGFVGEFLDETRNMFKARAMRMKALLNRINETGERTEALLRAAAERMEAAHASLEADLDKQGLSAGRDAEEEA